VGKVDGFGLRYKVLLDDVFAGLVESTDINFRDNSGFMLCIFFLACSLDRTQKSLNASFFNKSRLLYNKK
jgi:hypothetical protein